MKCTLIVADQPDLRERARMSLAMEDFAVREADRQTGHRAGGDAPARQPFSPREPQEPVGRAP